MDNDNTDGTGEVTAEIVSFQTNFGVSALDPPISVLYTVTGTPDSIDGFYVPVADASAGATAIGDRVVIARELLAGTNQAFNFDPSTPGVGWYRVGLIVMVGGIELTPTPESVGAIQVKGSPNPVFIKPVETTSVWQGDEPSILFDAGDPEGDVHWRLFYLSPTDSRSKLPDQLGTQLAVGSGNICEDCTFPTAGLAAGEYELGISATDSGYTVATTVAHGDLDRIVTIPNESQQGPIVRVVDVTEVEPPSVVFTAPGPGGVVLFRNEEYTLQFSVTIFESGASGVIELFYDDNDNIDDGFQDTIADEIPASTTWYPLPTNLPEGTWHIGATVHTVGGVAPPTTVYASGTVEIVRDPTLTVTAPDDPLPVAPSTPVEVAWTTNAPATSGNLDVFARTIESSGATTGPEIAILTGAPMTTNRATFSSDVSGLFEITVRLNLVDGTKITDTAPEDVRVSTIPRILWLGLLTNDDPPFGGAIFEGVQFEDNAGSSLSAAGDLDDDNLDDFVIASRYGKPFFQNPSGIGSGEAYIVYGAGPDRLLGEYNLNSVGSAELRGVTLLGIATVGDSNATDGLSDVALIPDAGIDELPELAFGFPEVDSAGATVGILEAAGQFNNGGVVILSSTNGILADPESGTPVINLAEVGQSFSDMTIEPSGDPNAFDDRLHFEPGDRDASPPTEDGCVEGGDGVVDTIIGPSMGFIAVLAPPRWLQIGLVFVESTAVEAEGRCRTQVDMPIICTGRSDLDPEDDAGSGFYPAEATPLEPFGARIIGPSEGDGFGTSVTSSNPLGDEGPGDLIISAPNRSALAAYVDGISSDLSNAGIGFIASNRNLWDHDTVGADTPPTPHQYVMGFASHCGDGRAPSLGALRIAGDSNDQIESILGLDDFNGDGRNDFAVGAPNAGGGQGRVYIAYRREESIEGDFVLNKLKRAPTDAERLDGMLIVTDETSDALGSSLATDVNFNGDDVSDLVIGSPDASDGVGEVVIVFGNPGIVSGANGISVDALLTRRTTDFAPVAVRITGNSRDTDGLFGFNVANAGDIDGDGFNDLLIAAPNASPRFDPFPNDSDDTLTEEGLDLDFDGIKDDVSSSTGQADGVVDTFDDLSNAGIVYVILGLNRLDEIRTCSDSGKACESEADCEAEEVCTTPTDMTISIDQLGTSQFRGFMIVGRSEGDRLGGGDAGDLNAGGISDKSGRGRSKGLASAGDVDGDGRADILIGSVLADPRRDPNSGIGVQNGGEAYLIYGSAAP